MDLLHKAGYIKSFKSHFCENLIVEETPLTKEQLQPIANRKVAVATIRGRSYYNITNALRLMDLKFESLSPEEAALSNAKVFITTEHEAQTVNKKGIVMLDTELENYPAVAKAKILRSIASLPADDQLVVGIDPGSRIGISVIYLQQEIASLVESSPYEAFEQVSAILGGIASKKKIVKIGDGNIAMARQIARMLKARFGDPVHIEIVDEHGTSRNTQANRRGIRDMSSARIIAFRSGKNFVLK